MRVPIASCIIHEEALKNSKIKKRLEHYNSCSEAEKEKIKQIDRFHALASLTNKKFIEGIITDISSKVKDYKITYTFYNKNLNILFMKMMKKKNLIVMTIS